MYCPKCGNKTEEKDKFCGSCGENLSNLKIKHVIEQNKITLTTPNENESINNQKKQKINKLIIIMPIILLIIIGTYLLINLTKTNEKITIMVYMVGSDLETYDAQATTDIKEMMNSKFNEDEVNLLIYTGGAKKWHIKEINSNENAIYKVYNDTLEKKTSFDKKSMGDPNTLKEFLDYCYDNYKDETTTFNLILWDHGGGPMLGYGSDEYYKYDLLTIEDLTEALKKSKFNTNQKLGFIGFDACLMSSIEVAHALSTYANYMVASEEQEPGNGWYYYFLKEINHNTEIKDVGKEIIDKFMEINDLYGLEDLSLALIDLEKVDKIENKMNSLFETMEDDYSIEYSQISRSRSKAKAYGKSGSSLGYDLVDLYNLIENLPIKYKDHANDLKNAIDEAVIYIGTNLANTHGLSVYFPYELKKSIDNYLEVYSNFNFAEEYTNYIKRFAGTLTGKREYEWDFSTTKPIEQDGKITLSITDEVRDNYSSASYILFEKKDEYYTPTFMGKDVELNGNTLETSISNKYIVAKNKTETVGLMALENTDEIGYTKYIIPGNVQRWTDDDNFNFEIQNVYFSFVVNNEYPNGKLVGATVVANEDELASKKNINIEEWKIIQLMSFKYKIFDEKGQYTSKWESSPEVLGFETKTNEDFTIEFEQLNPDKEYYALFKIKDNQGNVSYSNVIKVKL